MSFRGMTFDEQLVHARDDGALYASILTDGILWGCDISVSTDAVSIQKGQVIVGGRVVCIDGLEQISVTPTQGANFGRIILVIDISKTATQTALDQISFREEYSTTKEFPALVRGDINSGDDILREFELVRFTVSAGEVTGYFEPQRAVIKRQSEQGNVNSGKLALYGQGYLENCGDLESGTALVGSATVGAPTGVVSGLIIANKGFQFCEGYARYKNSATATWTEWRAVPENLPKPVNNGDIANKRYVDELIAQKFGDYSQGYIANCNSLMNGTGVVTPDTNNRPPGGGFGVILASNGSQICLGYQRVYAKDTGNFWSDWEPIPYDVFIKKAGDVVTGDLTFNGGRISGLSVPTVSHGAANKVYVDTQIDAKLSRSKGEFSPALYAGTTPAGGYASRKGYLVMNGNLCYISVYMILNSWASINQSTALTIKRATGKAIPQAALGGTRYELTVGITNYLHDGKVICAYIEPASDEIKICTRMGTALTRADFGDTAIISISGVYPIA